MILDSGKLIDFLCEHGITADQFLLCWSLYVDRAYEEGWDPLSKTYIEEGPSMAKVYKYYNSVKGWTKEDFDKLVEIGFLKDDNPQEPVRRTYPDKFTVTDKFIKALFASESAFEEFWNEYPAFTDNFKNPNGPRIPLRSVDKEEVERIYNKRIRSQEQHNRVMAALRWAVEHEEINMKITKWLKGEYYKEHFKSMKESSQQISQPTA